MCTANTATHLNAYAGNKIFIKVYGYKLHLCLPLGLSLETAIKSIFNHDNKSKVRLPFPSSALSILLTANRIYNVCYIN